MDETVLAFCVAGRWLRKLELMSSRPKTLAVCSKPARIDHPGISELNDIRFAASLHLHLYAKYHGMMTILQSTERMALLDAVVAFLIHYDWKKTQSVLAFTSANAS